MGPRHEILGFLPSPPPAARAVAPPPAWFAVIRRTRPEAAIPHVESALRESSAGRPPQLIPVKFVGGLLAIAPGSRSAGKGERADGADRGYLVVRNFPLSVAGLPRAARGRRGRGPRHRLQCAIAGAVFVLEELGARFEAGSPSAALGRRRRRSPWRGFCSATCRISRSRTFAPPGHGTGPLFFWPGVVAGLLAVVYNRTLLATQRSPAGSTAAGGVRAGLIGAGVGMLAWFVPISSAAAIRSLSGRWRAASCSPSFR